MKLAGTRWVIYYPEGTTKVGESDTDNVLIARTLLVGLEASEGAIVPVGCQLALKRYQ